MCGIIGILSLKNDVVDYLISGLKRLEYRGYDSSGIATISNYKLDRRRSVGKILNLQNFVTQNPLKGTIGIAHTRWATHGKADQTNAHPHSNEQIAVVHNGIIENFSNLKQELISKGYQFESETDTEVIVHLLFDYLKNGLSPKDAFQKTLLRLHGAFALVILLKDFPNMLLAARLGSPLVLGFSETEMYVGSDALALAPWTQTLCYLEEGDFAVIERLEQSFTTKLYTFDGKEVDRPLHKTKLNIDAISKGNFSHYMLKEMHEQPNCLAETLQSLINIETYQAKASLASLPFNTIKKITLIACGTSYYACMTAKYWFESLARIAIDVDIASEFRYRKPVLDDVDLAIVVSQSGETIDTLSAVRLLKENNIKVCSIVNVEESSIDRESDFTILTQAGPEIGVASTKAFTCQLLTFAVLSLYAAFSRNKITEDEFKKQIDHFSTLPSEILLALKLDDTIQKIASTLVHEKDVIYLGRGTNYPIALEGALKLKELSYIHAESYPSGELKHGPIALIDQQMPIVVIAPFDDWFLKTLSNIQEVVARGAKIIAITDELGHEHFLKQGLLDVDFIIFKKQQNAFLTPIVYSISVQLLAYYTAFFKGTDVDKPRNLAKSVTVE
jgi:glucosamine--fructose-6-phosphate aminotransferase (isomerizing)